MATALASVILTVPAIQRVATFGSAAQATSAFAAGESLRKAREAVLLPSVADTEPADVRRALLPPVARFRRSTRYLSHDSARLDSALAFALDAHAGQARRSGEPFAIHPITVATILAELKMDTDTIVAGLLHDTVEDTEVSIDDIRDGFGGGVATIVGGVTDGPASEPAANQCELLLAMSADWRVLLVKLADRLHNLRTLQHMPRAKQVRKAQETASLYVPLARRVGMSELETELQRLSARYLLPSGASSASVPGVPEARGCVPDPGSSHLLDSLLVKASILADIDVGARIAAHRSRWEEHKASC